MSGGPLAFFSYLCLERRQHEARVVGAPVLRMMVVCLFRQHDLIACEWLANSGGPGINWRAYRY